MAPVRESTCSQCEGVSSKPGGQGDQQLPSPGGGRECQGFRASSRRRGQCPAEIQSADRVLLQGNETMKPTVWAEQRTLCRPIPVTDTSHLLTEGIDDHDQAVFSTTTVPGDTGSETTRGSCCLGTYSLLRRRHRLSDYTHEHVATHGK